jgi:Ca2+-binding RTX toxin-like protein
MTGLGGNDRLAGLGGNDRLNGGLGNDRVSGGAGADTIHAEFNGIDTVNCGPGRDTATVASGDRVSNCEQLRRLQL